MSPEQKRKFNTFFGAVFMFSGAVAWGLTAWYAITPNPPKPAPVIGAPKTDLGSCRSALMTMGYQVQLKDREITLWEPMKDDTKAQLEQASIASLVCKIPMKSFCMGEGCERPGLTMVLAAPADDEPGTKPASAAPATGAAPKAQDKGGASQQPAKKSTSSQKPSAQKTGSASKSTATSNKSAIRQQK